MVRIILIRPGATDLQAQGRIQGTLNVPLNAEGQSEVVHMIDALRDEPLEMIFTAPGDPAEETAARLAEAFDLKTKTIDTLVNLDFGLWQGMQAIEVKRKQPSLYKQWQEHPESVRPPGGETLAELQQRICKCLSKLLKKQKTGCVGIVCPEPLASVVKSRLDGSELGDLWKAAEEHGAWEAIEVRVETTIETLHH